MARSLYRLMECEFEGGSEWWGWYDTDKEAIATFVMIFKERQRSKRKSDEEFKKWQIARHGKSIPTHHRKRAWIIERLGYMKPGTAIDEVNVPWKIIYTIQKGDD